MEKGATLYRSLFVLISLYICVSPGQSIILFAFNTKKSPNVVNFSSLAVTGLKVQLSTVAGVTDAKGNVATTGTVTVK